MQERCFLCGSTFAFGPNRYDGRFIRPWKAMACSQCEKWNHDGIVVDQPARDAFMAIGIVPPVDRDGRIHWPARGA